jgi:[acyl-carrier-protein] S-malonyltransferase
MTANAAVVAGQPISVQEVDNRESRLRASTPVASLPLAGTSEGRQLRRWLTQLIVTERVVAFEAARLGVTAAAAPGLKEVLPEGTARHELGSVTAAVLADPVARALFAYVTEYVEVDNEDVAAYHFRNPTRFAGSAPGPGGWRVRTPPPSLQQARPVITAHLLGSARRRAFRTWLDSRRATLVELAPGFEHPGDPRQPDNTHKH